MATRVLLLVLLLVGATALWGYLGGSAETPELRQIRQEHRRILKAYNAGDTATVERLRDGHAERWWVDRSPLAGETIDARGLRGPMEKVVDWVAPPEQPGEFFTRTESGVPCILCGEAWDGAPVMLRLGIYPFWISP